MSQLPAVSLVRREHMWPREIVGLVLIWAVGLAGCMLSGVVLPQLVELVPLPFLFAALLQGATAILAFGTRRVGRRPSRLVVVAMYAVGAVFALVLAVAMLGEGDGSFALRLPSWTLIYLASHFAFGLGCLAYVAVRSSRCDRPPIGRTFVAAVAATGALAVLLALALAALVPDRFSLLAFPERVLPVFQRLGIPVFAADALAATLLGRLRRPRGQERAMALAALAFALDVLVMGLSSGRFDGPWYASRALYVMGSGFVLASTLRRLVESRVRLEVAEGALATSLAASAQRASRIRALWKIATVEGLSDAEHAVAVLELAAANLRPGRPLVGVLWQVDGDEIVVEAIAGGSERPALGAASGFAPGARVAVPAPLQPLVLGGSTVHWDELEADDGGALVHSAGWRSVIGVPLRLAQATFLLTFASPVPLRDDPFAEDDVAFVEVVASHLTSRFYQRDQLARIRYQMEHDALTGLKNRTEFRKAVRLAASRNEPFAIAFVDLDRFRDINESQGHLVGDEILVEVAVALAGVDPNDLVARLGGDDFAIVAPGVRSESELAAKTARYAAVFERPFHTGDRLGRHFLPVAASAGCALFPLHAATVEELMQRADVALDVAKRRGGGLAIPFSPELEGEARERFLQRVELSEALEHGGFALAYQPTYDLERRHPGGAEALIRWPHPSRGLLLPADFLRAVERNGLTRRLTRWVFDRVIADLSAAVLPDGFRCYVNLPVRLLDDPAFGLELEQRLRSLRRLGSHLGVEITESDQIQNMERTIRSLRMIRDCGLRIAVDDFGTGYSSMAYLKRLPIDTIKIDKSFVDGLPSDEQDAALVETFLRLSQQFGLTSLAEGIETEAQAEWLRGHGCRLGQGYLFARPLPFDELLRTIKRSETARPA